MDYANFLASLSYSRISILSATSVALLLSGLEYLNNRSEWKENYEDLTDAQWDEIDNYIASAKKEIMLSLAGIVFPHVMGSILNLKLLPCDGAIYNRVDYPLLYDAIDSVYHINADTFRVPDYRNRVPVGTGSNYSLDDSGGVDSVTLSISEIPPHDHIYQYPNPGLDLEAPGAPDILALSNPGTPLATSSTGGGQAHENRMPYRAVNWVIVAG